jgi:UDP-GlcNAc3NAcA epimerase
VTLALREASHEEYLLHTGQHDDYLMSQVFFDELGLPAPNINLEVGPGRHGQQTGEMLARIEEAIIEQKPDTVLVYGDTNSALAGGLAACKLRVRLAHIEAGLRSFNCEMPKEHNRLLTDHCSDLLFCPTSTAVRNLEREGITRGVCQVGDTMYESVLRFADISRDRSTILKALHLMPGKYLLATVHRPSNTDNTENLGAIFDALAQTGETVISPMHPRTSSRLTDVARDIIPGSVRIIFPVGYFDMLMLQQHARRILTDSGGVQKEAYFLRVPCITLRDETEWIETLEGGWNILAGVDPARIQQAVASEPANPNARVELFGDGESGRHIVEQLTH